MKYKLLSVNNGPIQNIGDYVQALAASQFLPSIDGFINREELSNYDGDKCKLILNGWFMHHPENWPPSDKINPLFVAFHLNESVKEKMLTESGIKYLKQYEPIGCRDKYTATILNEVGISAYFSGCLTLTLGEKYKRPDFQEGVVVVDPMIPGSKSLLDLLRDLLFFCFNVSSVMKILNKLTSQYTGGKRLLFTTRFLRCYSKWFKKTELVQATYIQQETETFQKNFENDFARLKEAERLVGIYASAKYVLTSRIHCALPCLGIGTPVFFAIKDNLDFVSSCRMGGLMELFNVFKCSKHKVVPTFDIEGKISKNNIINNKEEWKALAEELAKKCMSFVND